MRKENISFKARPPIGKTRGGEEGPNSLAKAVINPNLKFSSDQLITTTGVNSGEKIRYKPRVEGDPSGDPTYSFVKPPDNTGTFNLNKIYIELDIEIKCTKDNIPIDAIQFAFKTDWPQKLIKNFTFRWNKTSIPTTRDHLVYSLHSTAAGTHFQHPTSLTHQRAIHKWYSYDKQEEMNTDPEFGIGNLRWKLKNDSGNPLAPFDILGYTTNGDPLVARKPTNTKHQSMLDQRIKINNVLRENNNIIRVRIPISKFIKTTNDKTFPANVELQVSFQIQKELSYYLEIPTTNQTFTVNYGSGDDQAMSFKPVEAISWVMKTPELCIEYLYPTSDVYTVANASFNTEGKKTAIAYIDVKHNAYTIPVGVLEHTIRYADGRTCPTTIRLSFRRNEQLPTQDIPTPKEVYSLRPNSQKVKEIRFRIAGGPENILKGHQQMYESTRKVFNNHLAAFDTWEKSGFPFVCFHTNVEGANTIFELGKDLAASLTITVIFEQQTNELIIMDVLGEINNVYQLGTDTGPVRVIDF